MTATLDFYEVIYTTLRGPLGPQNVLSFVRARNAAHAWDLVMQRDSRHAGADVETTNLAPYGGSARKVQPEPECEACGASDHVFTQFADNYGGCPLGAAYDEHVQSEIDYHLGK